MTVSFAGRDHPGEVISENNGWILCRIKIDPLWNYGSLNDRLGEISTVCVRAAFVRHTNNE